MAVDRMKIVPDDENEIHDALSHEDPDQIRITALFKLPPEAADAVIQAFSRLVIVGHQEEAVTGPVGGIRRAQLFEEGDVYMVEPPFDGYFSDRYIMDFYNVLERDICSRMHIHTGLRFVRIMTGPKTVVRVSSYSELLLEHSPAWMDEDLVQFRDDFQDDAFGYRWNIVVPENTWIDMQIPAGVSHQFNASGGHAIADSVHNEETIETVREQMSGSNMMAQTIFLAEELPKSETCALDPDNLPA